MLVAEGAVDVALEPVVSLWDLAALLLIVEEAGGRFTDLGGGRTADGGDAIAHQRAAARRGARDHRPVSAERPSNWRRADDRGGGRPDSRPGRR